MAAASPKRIEAALRKHALGYPEAYEEFPWGERAIKVKGRVFLFMRADTKVLSLSVKLPQSRHAALMLPFVEPTGYGLGPSGWVTARLKGGKSALETLKAWVDESYHAVAPKKLIARIEGQPAAPPSRAAAGRKRAGQAPKIVPHD